MITRPSDPRLDPIELLTQHFFGDNDSEQKFEEGSDKELGESDGEAGDFHLTVSELSIRSDLPEEAQAQDEPLTPRTQTVFVSLGKKKNAPFEKAIRNAPHAVNARNMGKTGDTPLMLLLRRQIKGGKELPEDKGIPKVKLLLAAGALWHVPNKKGETANDLVKRVPPKIRESFGR